MVKRTTMGFAAGVVLVWAGTAGAVDTQVIQRASVELDRVFIPALALTRSGSARAAGAAVSRLPGRWDGFREAVAAGETAGGAAADSLGAVEKGIAAASDAVDRPGGLAWAHEELERARGVLVAMRRDRGVSYYPDLMLAAHAPLEEAVSLVRARGEGRLSAEDQGRLAYLAAQARAAWSRVVAADFDPAAYGLSLEKAAERVRLERTVRVGLEELQDALRRSDRPLLAKTAPAVLRDFASLYKLFGDFEGLASVAEDGTDPS